MSDHPDYFGYSIFPQFGISKIEEGDLTLTADEYTELFTVTAKGRVYGGFWRSPDPLDTRDGVLKLEIDGVVVIDSTLQALFQNGYRSPSSHYLHLAVYDTISSLFIVNFSPEITFVREYKLSYYRGSPNSFKVYWKFIYAKLAI